MVRENLASVFLTGPQTSGCSFWRIPCSYHIFRFQQNRRILDAIKTKFFYPTKLSLLFQGQSTVLVHIDFHRIGAFQPLQKAKFFCPTELSLLFQGQSTVLVHIDFHRIGAFQSLQKAKFFHLPNSPYFSSVNQKLLPLLSHTSLITV